MRYLPRAIFGAFSFVILALLIDSSQPNLLSQTGQSSLEPENTADPVFRDKFDAGLGRSVEVVIEVDKVYFDSFDNLVLAAPVFALDRNRDLQYREARDKFEVVLAPAVAGQLKIQGIKNLQSYFQNQTIRVKGRAFWVDVLCWPSILIRQLSVESPDDIEVMKDSTK